MKSCFLPPSDTPRLIRGSNPESLTQGKLPLTSILRPKDWRLKLGKAIHNSCLQTTLKRIQHRPKPCWLKSVETHRKAKHVTDMWLFQLELIFKRKNWGKRHFEKVETLYFDLFGMECFSFDSIHNLKSQNQNKTFWFYQNKRFCWTWNNLFVQNFVGNFELLVLISFRMEICFQLLEFPTKQNKKIQVLPVWFRL